MVHTATHTRDEAEERYAEEMARLREHVNSGDGAPATVWIIAGRYRARKRAEQHRYELVQELQDELHFKIVIPPPWALWVLEHSLAAPETMFKIVRAGC